jgi:hypothetical protein
MSQRHAIVHLVGLDILKNPNPSQEIEPATSPGHEVIVMSKYHLWKYTCIIILTN